MALSNMAAYNDAILNPSELAPFAKTAFFAANSGMQSLWLGAGAPGAGVTPTAAVAPDRTTPGALGQRNADSGKELRLWLRSIQSGMANSFQFAIMIADRLSHQGGLSGTAITTQTTNLPTAALTRYTNGVGVVAGLEFYTQIGGSVANATVVYTDDSGNANQSSPLMPIAAGSAMAQNRILPIPLLQGDRGVRSVESVTLSATSGTVGNFGVTLFKPLLVLPVRVLADFASSGDPIRNLGGILPKVEAGACLQFMCIGPGQLTSNICGDIAFMET